MLNFFKNNKSNENGTYKTIDGKVVLVKQWPVKENKDKSWGRSGYDSLYN